MERLIDAITARDVSATQGQKTRLVLLDTLACAIGSMNDPVVRQMAERFGDLTPGDVRIPGTDMSTGVSEAAFVMTMVAAFQGE